MTKRNIVIWFPLIAIVLVCLYAMITANSVQSERVQIAQVSAPFVTLAGLVLAFWQATRAHQQAEKASKQTEKALVTDVLFHLYELYNTEEMHRAIKAVWQSIEGGGDGRDKLQAFLEKTTDTALLSNVTGNAKGLNSVAERCRTFGI